MVVILMVQGHSSLGRGWGKFGNLEVRCVYFLFIWMNSLSLAIAWGLKTNSFLPHLHLVLLKK